MHNKKLLRSYAFLVQTPQYNGMFLSKENLYRSTGKHAPIAFPKKASALSLLITMAILQERSQ